MTLTRRRRRAGQTKPYASAKGEKKDIVDTRYVKLCAATIDHEGQNNRISGIIGIVLTLADPSELPSKLLLNNYKPDNLWTNSRRSNR